MTATTPTSDRDTATPGGTPALVVVAHGSRDPRALSTVRALLDRVRLLRPALPVHLGHIELNEPLLPGTLAALGGGEAVLVPLLLGRGYHVKRDI
ncbi:CbiX/SirB N-terminal domain-containing protein, partial [Streptomyces coelicoflavus]|uniref:sirohydrochlorin chelatase n=2 Tax=Streptomyces TaxID=1883 RepID=UPI00210D890A